MQGEKERILEKYGLFLENGGWYSDKENAHKHLICKDSFLQRTDVIGLLFRINKLCMAKVKYFRKRIDKFVPMKYDYHTGFLEAPLWDAEFLKHAASGAILDFRFLQSITEYQRFLDLVAELESFEEDPSPAE